MRRVVSVLISMIFLTACHGTMPQDSDMRMAEVAMQNGSPDVALSVARKSLKQNPDDIHALCLQGNAEGLKERLPQAEASFDRVLALKSNENCALIGLGRLKLRIDPQKASSLLEHAVHGPSPDPAAEVDLGIAYDLQGEHEKAQHLYTQVIAENPENTDAIINMGLSLALSGKADEGLLYLEPLTHKANCPPRVRGNAAFAMVQSGRIHDAEALLRSYLSPQETQKVIKRYAAFR